MLPPPSTPRSRRVQAEGGSVIDLRSAIAEDEKEDEDDDDDDY